jgi:hypothetical protein
VASDSEDTPITEVTPELAWEELMQAREERHKLQRILDGIRQRVARLEGSAASGDQTIHRVPLRGG